MKIAVVILNWNGVQLLEQFLPSVMRYSAEAKIYVADNASTDASVSFVKAEYPNITILQNSGNHGYAKGYNEALQFVTEPIYALVNSDIEVTAGWLQPVLAAFEQDDVAILQPKILDFKRKEYFEYAGAAGGFIDKYGYPFCCGRIFDTLEKDLGQYNDDRDIFWASGACFFIKNEVFHKLNGFDEDYFAHQEEIDLCWRAFNSGHKCRYVSSSVVYHVGGATLKQGNPHKTYLNFRNSLLMLVKNLPASSLYYVLLIRLLLDGLAGVQFLAQGKGSHSIAIIRAHGSFYRLFSANYKKRQQQQQSSRYYLVKSIVFLYFIKKHTTFGKLF